MADSFETWAPREIRRLREEADVLQLAYDRFTAAQSVLRKPRTNAAVAPVDNATRKSKYEPLYAKWAEASYRGPIGYELMEKIAQQAGFNLKGNLLRSTVHAAKKAGRVTADGDGYLWKLVEPVEADAEPDDDAAGAEPEPETKTAPSNSEGAV